MKLRFIKFFILVFILIFAVLNGRFIYTNAKYLLTDNPPQKLSQDKTAKLPLSPSKTIPPLPSQASITIDRIGVSAPIVFDVGSDLNNVYSNLQRGVVHYSSTPKPGTQGTSIILGHSSAYPWYKGSYGSVFALLGRLQADDVIRIQYADGSTFSFAVKQTIVFSPLSDDSRLQEIEKSPSSSIVLVSCWPVGTNYKRIAVQAELI